MLRAAGCQGSELRAYGFVVLGFGGEREGHTGSMPDLRAEISHERPCLPPLNTATLKLIHPELTGPVDPSFRALSGRLKFTI